MLDETIDANIAAIELVFPRLVEAELLEQLSMARRVNAARARHGFDGIARHHADQEKHQQRHAQKGRNDQAAQARENKAEHYCERLTRDGKVCLLQSCERAQ